MYQWCALVVVVAGVALVGLAGALGANPHEQVPTTASKEMLLLARRAGSAIVATGKTPDAVRTTLGVLMIAGAQIFTATQFVVEEFILEKYAVEPLRMVGWEGIFGFSITFIGMVIMHFAVGRTGNNHYDYFDAVEGWAQLTENKQILVSSILIMISIGGFNYFGLSITRTVSATSRSVIDTCRTLFIWIVSLGLGWETFKWLQIVGFVLLVYGTFLFNDLIGTRWRSLLKRERSAPLLVEEPIEHF